MKNFSITIENAQNSSIRISNPPLIQKNESKEKSDVTIKQCENPTRKESVNMKEISQENIEECSISTFEYLWYFLRKIFCFCGGRKTERERIIGKAEKVYKREIDVLNIVRRLQEIESLKFLLLDKDQMMLFNHLKRPLISTKYRTFYEERPNKTKIMDKVLKEKDKEKLVSAYRSCEQK